MPVTPTEDGNLTAVVLAGGLGTRLRSVVAAIPKILAPVAGRPFLDHLLSHLAGQGVRDIVLAVGYKAHEVVDYCSDGSHWRLRVRYSRETTPLGTGGALKLAQPHIRSNPFLLLNGDSYVQFNLNRLVDFHIRNGALVTVLLAHAEKRDRFGAVELDDEGRIVTFQEKGRGGCGLVNAGVYMMQKDILGRIPGRRHVSLESEILPELETCKRLGMVTTAELVDIGTPESYAHAQAFFQQAGER